MSIHRVALAASAAILAASFATGSASAMPLGNLKPAAETVTVTPQNVAWVCGPYRCWWQPGPAWRPYGFYGPRPWRYGWYRPYRRWW